MNDNKRKTTEREHGKSKRVLREKMITNKLGTWNIRSIHGKEIELVNEFERAGLEILILPEIKKKGNGLAEIENQHLLIWSGVQEEKRAQAGIGCLIHRNNKGQLHTWKAISERILLVEFKYELQVETIIAVYGPSEDEKVEKKDIFWAELGTTVETAKGNIFIVGDLNARVGRRDNVYNVIGRHGEAFRNTNGKRLLNFCVIYSLIVANSFFEHKDIHKYTREEPSRNEKSIIDYIIVERENRMAINDVVVKRGFEIHSDHYLVVAKIKRHKEGLIQENKKASSETIRAYKLKVERIARLYENKVDKELEKIQVDLSSLELEEMWLLLRKTIIQAAKEVCGTFRRNNNKKQTAWWTEEVKQQVKFKKEKWQKYLSNKTGTNYEAYKQQRLIVKNLVLQSKQKSWAEFGEKLEKDSKSNQKLFYRVLKNLRNTNRTTALTIKNKKGDVLKKEEDIMDRWREHFQELLNENEEVENNAAEVTERERQIDNNESNITIEELTDAIRELKNGKSPGADKITAEMVKAMGERGTNLLLEIFKRIWIEERIPKEWEMGLIVPLFKKGDSSDCNNYRGITLLSTVLKLFEKIIEKRLRKEIEPTLSEAQSGFRKGRCTQDHIFTIKEITDRALITGKEVYVAFMDMEKAFDRVPRKKIWEVLEERNVNSKLIKIVKCMYKETRNKIISKNSMSREFNTKEGVRQGGSLSPLLFIAFMDKIIKETERKVKPFYIGYRFLEKVEIRECAFADDVAIIAGNEKALRENLEIWNQTLQNNSMKMNKSKTKVMVISKERKSLEIKIDNEHIEQVSSFQYLGRALEETGKQEIEIRNRIEKANKTYYALNKGILNKKEVSRKTKMNVYKAIYRPILTYGCESWVLTKQEKSQIGAIEMKYLRKVRGVTKLDRMRNEDIRRDLEIESIEQFIEKRQLGWWGHIQRMDNSVQVKKAWETRVQGKRGRGRPKQTWNNAVGQILEKKNLEWREARILAQSRKDWNKFISL